MTRLLASRVAQALLVVWLVVTTTFVVVRLAPGDPFSAIVEDPDASPELQAIRRAQYGLDDPMLVQYGRFVSRALRGDLGVSLSSNLPVTEVLAHAIPRTVLLAGTALLVAFTAGIALGAWQGWRPASVSARVTHRVGVVLVAVPEFILALLLILGPALAWGLFPTGRMRGAFPATGFAGVVEVAWHLTLPALSLGIVLAAVIARHQRAALLAVRGKEFVRTARAKGVPEQRVLVRHALRNALAPVIALAGVLLPTVVGGAVLVEQIFSWPGMGAAAIDAVLARDYPVLVGCVLVSSVAVVVGTFVADVALLWADPRTRGRR